MNEKPPSKREFNHAEWSNSNNWNGNWLYPVYFSRRDSRLFVRRFRDSRLMPTTINMGHRWGLAALSRIFFVFTAVVALIVYMETYRAIAR